MHTTYLTMYKSVTLLELGAYFNLQSGFESYHTLKIAHF